MAAEPAAGLALVPVQPPVQEEEAASDDVAARAMRDSGVVSPAMRTPLYATPTQSIVAGLNALEYPSPVATHEAILQDERVFFDAFNKLHEALGTRSNVPKMGGKDLNIHLLYREVIARGGLHQVIKDRKWKEITNAFEFPRTTTSASYVLRKYYINLLYHFEQVYKNKAKGPLIPPPVTSSSTPAGAVGPLQLGLEIGKRGRRKRKHVPYIPQEDPSEVVGSICKGSIEAKLECGYVVSVVIGGEKVQGIMYEVQPRGGKVPPQFTHIPELLANVNSDAARASLETSKRRKRRRKDEMPKKDPNAPRPNRTGYNFFFAEQRQRLKQLYPDKDREISRMIGEAWNSLTEEQKNPYQERGVKDKERFKREIRDYREKKLSGFFDRVADPNQAQNEASPVDPRVPEHPSEEDYPNSLGNDDHHRAEASGANAAELQEDSNIVTPQTQTLQVLGSHQEAQ